MSHWEAAGQSDEWYTPRYVFEALGCVFDMDVAGSYIRPVPAFVTITENSLSSQWEGFIWMNAPFGGRNSLSPWLDRFFDHGNGIALTPDRTSAPWWQEAARRTEAILFVSGKIKFIRSDGTTGDSPSTGTTLFAVGQKGTEALGRASRRGLGAFYIPAPQRPVKEAAE